MPLRDITAADRSAAELLDSLTFRALAGGRLGEKPWLNPNSYVRASVPGLEVVTGKRDLLAVAGAADHGLPVERARIDERLFVETFGPGALWRSSLRPGDALVFAGTTVHRSHVTPAMTKHRLSVEMRLVAVAVG